jgi:hypothetical protein
MKSLKTITSDLLFDALINAPVSDREWVEMLVACASKHKTIHAAMHKVFRLEGLFLSPKKWVQVEEAAQRLNPKPPEFITHAYTSLAFICDNFNNAGKCIFANQEKDAVDWILSGKDTKRVAMPKKLSRKPKKPYGEGARLLLNNFRERDDRSAWNKCK